MVSFGITGGIGSGKSTVCRVFETLGIPVFYADAEARRLQNEDVTVREAIKILLGNDVYSTKGLNRKAVAEKVFADKNLLDKLNSIVHPATVAAFENWKLKHHEKTYCLKEAAILFETEIAQTLYKNIVVTAPEVLRVQRIVKRDSSTPEEVIARMKNQMTDEEKVKLSDFVIINDEKHPILPQIIKLHKALLVLSGV